ncbi:UNVERIFIED_CONTAM: hypothetical protein FKN15_024124 [Acipenser sinensis]
MQNSQTIGHKNNLLEDSEPCENEQVLMEVGKMIGSYPFKFQGDHILSGVEEGAYGWITINYLLSSFIKACSAFFYTFDFLKLAPQSSLDVKKKTTEEFCKRDWSSMRIGADDTDNGWMLGYMLNLTNLIPTETPAR